MGDKLVVCAGAIGNIVCLDRAAGTVVWRLKRVWEFGRGFIGPSVWQHLMSRQGANAPEPETQTTDAPGLASSQNQACVIIGGPVVVPTASAPPRLFVAVAKGAGEFSRYVSDCFVYEIDENGEPVAIINVPRMIIGPRFALFEDSVIWACQNNAFVRIAPSEQEPIGEGPHAPDCVGHIEWYREFRSPEPPAWLRADRAADPVAFTTTHAFRLAGGGYVLSRNDGLYHFPLEVVDLATGLRHRMSLEVPYTGHLVEPETNFRSEPGPDGTLQIHTWGWYGFAPTRIDCSDGALLITLGTETSTSVVHFSLKEIEQMHEGDRPTP